MSFLARITKLRETAFGGKAGFDGYLIFGGTNMLYFLGFPGTSALLVPPDGQSTVYVYGVNYEQTKAEAKGFKIVLLKRGEKVGEKIGPGLKALKVKKLASDMLSYELHRFLAKAIRLSFLSLQRWSCKSFRETSIGRRSAGFAKSVVRWADQDPAWSPAT